MIGGKTGTTTQAGSCLILLTKNKDGEEFISVVLKGVTKSALYHTMTDESLTNLKHTLDREREEKLNVKKLNDYFQEVLPKLQSNFFISLIEGRVEKHDYERFLQAYQVDMKGPLFGCVIFHTSENHVPEGMNPLLLSMSVEREIKQRLMDQWNCREFIYMGKYTADSGTGCGR